MAKKQTETSEPAAPAGRIPADLQEKILVAYSVIAKRLKNVNGLKQASKDAKADLEAARSVLEQLLAEAAGDLDAPLFDQAEQFVDAAAAEHEAARTTPADDGEGE